MMLQRACYVHVVLNINSRSGTMSHGVVLCLMGSAPEQTIPDQT